MNATVVLQGAESTPSQVGQLRTAFLALKGCIGKHRLNDLRHASVAGLGPSHLFFNIGFESASPSCQLLGPIGHHLTLDCLLHAHQMLVSCARHVGLLFEGTNSTPSSERAIIESDLVLQSIPRILGHFVVDALSIRWPTPTNMSLRRVGIGDHDLIVLCEARSKVSRARRWLSRSLA
jgi:hypothetical protein